jgi:hypothetical protein
MNKCPECGGSVSCLCGHSAHPSNWYCDDESGCGWHAWRDIDYTTECKQVKTMKKRKLKKRIKRLESYCESMFQLLEIKLCTDEKRIACHIKEVYEKELKGISGK